MNILKTSGNYVFGLFHKAPSTNMDGYKMCWAIYYAMDAVTGLDAMMGCLAWIGKWRSIF